MDNKTTDGKSLTTHVDNLAGAIDHFMKVIELDYYDLHDGNDIARYENLKDKVHLYLARLMENAALTLHDLENKVRASEISRRSLEQFHENRDLVQEYNAVTRGR
jgi:hypothetical protein